MSKRMIFGTCIKDQDRLAKAVRELREHSEQPVNVEGPRFVSSYPFNGKRVDAWVIKFADWYGDCAFAADGSGLMSGDNESEYFDSRPLDAEGEPIDLDESGRPHPVHPLVKTGEKRAGDDGSLGDIRHLRRLIGEYTAIGIEEAAVEAGATVAYKTIDSETGELEMGVDYPEVVQY